MTLHDITLDVEGVGNVTSNLISFGNNTITATGNGTDTLYAAMHDLVLTMDSVSFVGNPPELYGNTITFGTNVVNAGISNVTLVGELNHIDLPDLGEASFGVFNLETTDLFLNNNTSNPGQNTFNLHGYHPVLATAASGKGVDTLVFDPAIEIGQNIVNHFNSATDGLQFNNVAPTGTEMAPSLADLENLIQNMTNDGHGGTLLTFKAVMNQAGARGAIDFVNNSFKNSHFTVDQHLHDLVNNQTGHLAIFA
jgi:hypothetical protein